MKNPSTLNVNQTGFTSREIKVAVKVLNGEIDIKDSGLNPIQIELLLKE